MAFASVPAELKSNINRAGAILASTGPDPSEFAWALDLTHRWRACHAYPINTFQATLRTKLRICEGNPIVAQRLKRMPTIIDKLKRYPMMKLTTMQDIGGIRAIVNSVLDAYRLAAEYKDSKRFYHELINHKDYIFCPRNEDGYRSLHLIYSYKNRRNPAYNGLRIELQIRTRLQHIWATAVESMGTFLGQALKSRQGDQEWLDFFALVSSAFAHQEGTTPVPKYANLSLEETCYEIAEAEYKLRALSLMEGLSAAVKEISRTRNAGKARFYHLIILKSLEHTVEIKAYDRDSFEQAERDYGQAEEEASRGAKIEPVLVSAGPLDELRRAYPNFFLDINDFSGTVKELVDRVR